MNAFTHPTPSRVPSTLTVMPSSITSINARPHGVSQHVYQSRTQCSRASSFFTKAARYLRRRAHWGGAPPPNMWIMV